jgi:sortase A
MGVDRFAQSNGLGYLNRLERLLMCCGLLLLFLYVANRTYGAIYSRSSLQSFWAAEASAQAQVRIKPQSSSPPDFSLWSEKRVRAYHTSLAANVSPPLGVLDIPSLRLQVPVLEGTDDLTLDRAVGHITGTASLGEPGNTGIAGHRDGFFRVLKDIHVGETVDLYTQHGRSRYVVDEIQIVSPDSVSVLAPRAKPSLTLVTCYPFYFVGSAPSRYIVHATVADVDDLKKSETPGHKAKARIDGRTN